MPIFTKEIVSNPEPNQFLKNACPECGGDIYEDKCREVTYFAGLPVSSSKVYVADLFCNDCRVIFELEMENELIKQKHIRLLSEKLDPNEEIIDLEIIPNDEGYQIQYKTKRKNKTTFNVRENDVEFEKKMALFNKALIISSLYFLSENFVDLSTIKDFEFEYEFPGMDEFIKNSKRLNPVDLEKLNFEILNEYKKEFERGFNIFNNIIEVEKANGLFFGGGTNPTAVELMNYFNIPELNQKSYWNSII